MFPSIVQVIPTDDYKVYVYFDDGKIVCYDVTPFLEKEVFKVLKDKKIFKDSCTIMNHTLAFDISGNRDSYNCIDIDPETLYGLNEVPENTSLFC